MSSALGLIELLIVLLGVMGWAAFELWSLRRRRPGQPKRRGGRDTAEP